MWRNPLIPPHIWDPDKQFSKRDLTAEERFDQHNRTVRLKKEILNEYVHPFHIDSPYYYGTKDIRPPYKDIDAKNYENSKKEWDETLEALYGDDPVPELIPLTLEEMGVKPELAKPITEEQKERTAARCAAAAPRRSVHAVLDELAASQRSRQRSSQPLSAGKLATACLPPCCCRHLSPPTGAADISPDTHQSVARGAPQSCTLRRPRHLHAACVSRGKRALPRRAASPRLAALSI